MQFLSEEMSGHLKNSSWIRKMFEAGIELRKEFGDENVYDFSLGNPDLPPPAKVKDTLHKIADGILDPFSLGYMPNGGYVEFREALAAKLSKEQGVSIPMSNVIATCGAAGGLNVFFRTVLEKGDKVLVPAPYFMEYNFYTSNFGGKLVPVKSKDFTFELDVEAIKAAITPECRALILNSPNNPTGQIYSRREISELAAVLLAKSEEYGRPIYLISDEPYRFLNYDNMDIPSLFELYPYSVVIGSYSKSLSLAGERIGYIAVNPAIGADAAPLMGGLIMSNRILGFVNAPALAQKILIDCIDEEVDMNVYLKRRNAMAEVLDRAGIEYTMPKGAFYFFPKAPGGDEGRFMDALVRNHVLAVPGVGFGCPGYFRMTFCVSEDVIYRASDAICKAASECKN